MMAQKLAKKTASARGVKYKKIAAKHKLKYTTQK